MKDDNLWEISETKTNVSKKKAKKRVKEKRVEEKATCMHDESEVSELIEVFDEKTAEGQIRFMMKEFKMERKKLEALFREANGDGYKVMNLLQGKL